MSGPMIEPWGTPKLTLQSFMFAGGLHPFKYGWENIFDEKKLNMEMDSIRFALLNKFKILST